MFVAFSVNRQKKKKSFLLAQLHQFHSQVLRIGRFVAGMWGLRFCSLWVLNVKDRSRLKLGIRGTHLHKYWGT